MKTRQLAMLVSLLLTICSGAATIYLAANEKMFGGNTMVVLGVCVAIFFVSLIVAAGTASLRNSSLRNRASGNVVVIPRRKSPPDRAAIAAKLDEIIAEMKRINVWQTEPLAPEKMNFKQAFAIDSMAFTQWLQFVFIPRVRDLNEGNGDWPAQSMVAAQSAREFDDSDEMRQLHRLLIEFDVLIDPKAYS
ncbi:MAG: YqcC family protein [Usitatibacteraceae bacterium]